MTARGTWVGVGGLLAGCGDFRDCAEVDTRAAEALPAALSAAGLYADIDADVVVAEALAFEPRFPLWTDGAAKRRWLVLPAGAQVDTRDPDDWRFPVGTTAFKEFVRDGVRVETRMLARTPDGWTGVAYVWDGADAFATAVGLADAGGTDHDVPDAAQCLACHGGRASVLLGFSEVQLDAAARDDLFAAGWLSTPAPDARALAEPARAGLGVLHANCSHCHNPERRDLPAAPACFQPDNPFDFTLPVGLAALADAPAVLTAARALGAPSRSLVLDRMSSRDTSALSPSMPPLGTEVVDDLGVAAVRSMIEALP
jgi:mono/diheme cytochrome c family protein